jgi:sialidase-1
MQAVFNGDSRSLREPYLAVAVDGTILALQNRPGLLRRSEDGGKTWGEIIEVPFGFMDSNFITDENTGDIIVLRLWDGNDRLWRSSDHGKTWREENIILKPNELIKWIEQAGLMKRVSWNERGEGYGENGKYTIHSNASESGITLRHGKKKGRLIVTSTFRPHAPEHPSDRDPLEAIYSCAVYSDDGGATWQVSGLFPEGYTEEAALTELSDGRIYYNSRSCSGFYDKSLARELKPEEVMRREAWSYDYGHTWEDLKVSSVLPDGGGADRGYGCKGGLVRLPVENRDILIYSNTDAGPGAREKMTVWASFDGGETWPVKRLIHEPRGAYSSLGAGRPGTPGEGLIYLLFEDRYADPRSSTHPPDATMQVARFNLSWILGGELTGNGMIPDWL